MSNTLNTEEYIYLTIPVQYNPTYQRILVLLADYGEDMLKDCKAACKDRNSNVVDCFNMFNAALAAYELGKTKLADTIIKYVNAKITQIYGGSIDIEPGPTPPVEYNYWYIGQITKTKSQFAELTAEELLACATAYTTRQKTGNITINESCWFCMVPAGYDILQAQYIVSGITSSFTEEQIKNGFVSGVTHDDIEINGINYKIYVNRNTALINSNANGSFTLK